MPARRRPGPSTGHVCLTVVVSTPRCRSSVGRASASYRRGHTPGWSSQADCWGESPGPSVRCRATTSRRAAVQIFDAVQAAMVATRCRRRSCRGAVGFSARATRSRGPTRVPDSSIVVMATPGRCTCDANVGTPCLAFKTHVQVPSGLAGRWPIQDRHVQSPARDRRVSAPHCGLRAAP